jgi:hypothetical protein
VGISIRQAQLSDIDWLLQELEKFSNFYASKYKLFSTDEKYNRALITSIVQSHLVIVAYKEDTGEQVGFIAGTIAGHIYNPEIKTLSEMFWWVQEEHRLGRAGMLLLHAFIEYGKKNCQWVTMTIEDNSPINPDSLLRRGFKPKEVSFIMEI